MRLFALVVFMALLLGCAHSYELSTRPADIAVPRLSPDTKVYVALPEDGSYGSTVYNGSGPMTAKAIAKSFLKYCVEVMEESSHQSYATALEEARKQGCDLLVYPVILHWEERATEWSGLPDRISIKLTLTDAKTEKLLDSIVIDGKSRWATFGGDHPQDLLPEPIDRYVGTLFK